MGDVDVEEKFAENETIKMINFWWYTPRALCCSKV